MHRFNIIANNQLSKVQQIVETIKRDIEKGLLKKNDKLPSINNFNEQYNVARDTVEKAYNILKTEGFIVSLASKGYFVIGKKENRLKVLLIFNKLSSYKKIVYDSFIQTLGKKAKVDLQIHHYDPRLLKEIIEANLGTYHYYAIMPHFFLDANQAECRAIIELVPDNELVILDKKVKGLKRDCIEVCQDFELDIYNALISAGGMLNKYLHVGIVMEKGSHHPKEIITGVKKYCKGHHKEMSVSYNADGLVLQPASVYIITSESDLGIIIKKIRSAGWKLGRDIGIISFNETVLKELLEIAVMTTDFEAMGRTAAQCILNKEVRKIKNPFYMIERKSI